MPARASPDVLDRDRCDPSSSMSLTRSRSPRSSSVVSALLADGPRSCSHPPGDMAMVTSIDQKKRLSAADLRNQRAAQGRVLSLRLLNNVRTGRPPAGRRRPRRSRGSDESTRPESRYPWIRSLFTLSGGRNVGVARARTRPRFPGLAPGLRSGCAIRSSSPIDDLT